MCICNLSRLCTNICLRKTWRMGLGYKDLAIQCKGHGWWDQVKWTMYNYKHFNESFDEVVNDIQWGENGSITKLLNIATTTKDVGIEVEVNVQKEEDQKCLVEMPNNPTLTHGKSPIYVIYDLGVVLNGPTNEV